MLDIVEIDKFNGGSSFLQSEFWANFKNKNGWKFKFFLVKYEDEGEEIYISFQFSVLLRSLRFFGTFAYVPMLPNFLQEYEKIENDAEKDNCRCFKEKFLAQLSEKLFEFLENDMFFIRFDASWQVEVDNRAGRASCEKKVERPSFVFGKYGVVNIGKAFYDVQPPDTVILDLTLSEDELIAQFKSKCRYNIKLAEKRGCLVECVDMKDEESIKNGIDLFYSLYEITSKRDGIAIHNIGYYRNLFVEALKDETLSLRLYVAKYENKLLASIITIFYRDEATYLYGASSNECRNLMSTYLLQYQAIKDAKQYGCKIYDFYGIPPTEDIRHAMAGLYRFKSGFGGKIVHRIGSIDVYKNSLLYTLYSFAEHMRSFYFKKLKKIFVRKK